MLGSHLPNFGAAKLDFHINRDISRDSVMTTINC